MNTNMAQEPVNQDVEDQDLLLALIFGVLHEEDIVGGAEFAAKLAICARMTNGKDRKSTRLNSSHIQKSRMPSSA